MKEHHSMNYSINQTDLWLLLDFFSPYIVIGFKDFTQSILEEELIEIRKIAFNDLKEKGILITDDQDQRLITSPLKEMLHTIAHPTHAIMVGAHSPGNGRVHSFYYSADTNIVHMAACDGDQYELSVIENRAALIDLIMGLHLTMPQYQDPSEHFYLQKDIIDQARELTQTVHQAAAVEILTEAGLEKNVAEAYTETIKSSALTMPLLAYWNLNDPHHLQVKGFVTESSPEHLWIIDLMDEELEQARVTHATRSMLKNKLDTILP